MVNMPSETLIATSYVPAGARSVPAICQPSSIRETVSPSGRPAASTVAKAAFDDVHVADDVRSCVLLSV